MDQEMTTDVPFIQLACPNPRFHCPGTSHSILHICNVCEEPHMDLECTTCGYRSIERVPEGDPPTSPRTSS
jgi:hypothetical protein